MLKEKEEPLTFMTFWKLALLLSTDPRTPKQIGFQNTMLHYKLG